MSTALDYRYVKSLVSSILPFPIAEDVVYSLITPDLDFPMEAYDEQGYLNPISFSSTCPCGRTPSTGQILRDSCKNYRIYIDMECSFDGCSQAKENFLYFVDLRTKGYITTQEETVSTSNSGTLRFSSYITEKAEESKFRYLSLEYS